jgi:SAM-dependent methyltransferase
MMDANIITHLNILWEPVYPHLARWIEPWIAADNGHILEMGPFSGGIINALLERKPTLRGLIALSHKNAAETIGKSYGPPCPVLLLPLTRFPLMPTFDLVVCRGAFFFLTPEIIKESCRILKPGGYALLGGGYGPLTPNEIIAPIADESRDLNYRLGKVRFSRSNLEKMVAQAGLESRGTIIEDGGLWLLISKES